ncbi:pyruvate dehydrogenase complex dihydrolipoamide acetyltransferase [Camelimonas abortus]|uniref:Acetyltransferase component of pyruvate dehydrogenase complex n=1 Tax=Camelimonas abortus TaxID=1017184 RepID=A0ABV7LD23_9HYPH
MPIQVLMPALSPTMEKGRLSRWLAQEGDAVKPGDVIAEIETDKATMEVEAADEGVLARIVVPEGTDDVPVNAVIAIIAAEGETVEAAAAAADATPAPQAKPRTQEAASPAPEAASPAPETVSPAPEAAARPAPEAAGPAAASTGGRVFASPLARRVAKEAGVDLSALKGSGPRGRIIERDVLEAKKSGVAAKPQAGAAPAVLAAAPDGAAVRAMFAPGSYEEIPLDGMRRTIARRLVESKQTIPHFYLTADCEIDALLALRQQLNAAAPRDADGRPEWKVSVNDLVVKAFAGALRRTPDANVSFAGDAILRHRPVDVGVAVSIPGGLITPVVRDADRLAISALSQQIRDLAARAQNRRLKPEEYTGGSAAVSNLGMYGVREFAAVINPPHATILAVGEGQQRVIVKNGQPAVATMMTVTLSVDHRAVDGVLGARLLQAFRALVENPAAILA